MDVCGGGDGGDGGGDGGGGNYAQCPDDDVRQGGCKPTLTPPRPRLCTYGPFWCSVAAFPLYDITDLFRSSFGLTMHSG